jgi:hypothetical protein
MAKLILSVDDAKKIYPHIAVMKNGEKVEAKVGAVLAKIEICDDGKAVFDVPAIDTSANPPIYS